LKIQVETEEAKVSDYYLLDFHNGELKSRAMGSRVFVLGSDAWIALRAALYSRFSSGAAVIFHEMGLNYGVMIAKDLGLKSLDSEKVRKVGAISGWGRFEVIGDIGSGKLVKLIVKNCVFCRDGNYDFPCQFLRGTMEGMLNSIYGKEHVSAVNCKSDGSDKSKHICEIIVKES